MKIMWVGMAVLGAIFAMAFECVMARRDRRVRCILEQPLQGIEKERGRLYRILFVTSLLCMLYGCIVVASHRRWVTPVQGVAVVIDAAASVSDKDPSVLLSIQKAAAKELIQSLPLLFLLLLIAYFLNCS